MTEAVPVAVEEYEYEGLGGEYTLGANMAAGALAGIAEHSVVYPVDLVKTRLQILRPAPGGLYSSVINAFATVSRVEGTSALWRGLPSAMLGAGPAHAAHFVTLETVKQALGGNADAKHHPFIAAASGAAATTTNEAIMTPFDVIKQRMQVQGSSYRSVFSAARDVYAKEGLRAFFVSYPTTLSMSMPFQALQFTAYESLSKVMRDPRQEKQPLVYVTAGALSGAFAATLTTPLDVCKTVLQTRGTSSDAEVRSARGLFGAASIIRRRHGWAGFTRGLWPRVITAMPSHAVCWGSYEVAKRYFKAQQLERDS